MIIKKRFFLWAIFPLISLMVGCGDASQSEGKPETAVPSEALTNGNSVPATGVGSSSDTVRPQSVEEVLRTVTLPDGQQLHFLRTATVTGIQENRKFQENLTFVSQKLAAYLKLKEEYETSVDPEKREGLEPKLESAKTTFEESDQQMQKLYQLSLTRNYVVLPEVSYLYIQATTEELESLDQANQQ